MAIFTLANGQQSTFTTQLASASVVAGDTIQIPAGSWTWTGGVVINKAIKMVGLGVWTGGSGLPVVGGCQIINATTTSTDLIAVNTVAGSPNFLCQNIAFLDNGSAGGHSLHLLGSGVPLINNCYFLDIISSADLYFSMNWGSGNGGGVAWGNTFYTQDTFAQCIGFYHPTSNPSPSWQNPSSMGMMDPNGTGNTYVENNIFNNCFQQAFDVSDEARVVIRNNIFNNSGGSGHGQDTGENGARHYEFYNNTWIFCLGGSLSLAGTLVSGSKTVVVPNVNGLGIGQNVTGTGIPSGTRLANVISTTQIVLTNAATTNGATTMTISGADSFTTTGNYPMNINFLVFERGGTGVIWGNNFPRVNSSTWGSKSAIQISNFNTDITPHAVPQQTVYPSAEQPGQTWVGTSSQSCTLNGTTSVTVSGNTNRIARAIAVTGTGIPASTTVTNVTGANTFTMSNAATVSGTQTLTFTGYSFQTPGTTAIDGTGFGTDPWVVWGNTGAAVSSAGWIGLNGTTINTYVQSGRDFIDNSVSGTAKPGYTPYTYPHPLVGGDTTAPSVPVPVFGAVTSTSITLTWPTSTDVDNANNTLTYNIQRQINGGAFSPLVSGYAGVVTGNVTYVDSPLTPSTSYGYRVESFDPALNTNGFSATITTSTSASLDPRFGFAAHFGATSADSITLMPLISATGAGVIRSEISWHAMNVAGGGTPGNFAPDTKDDNWINACAAQGMKAVCIAGGNSIWTIARTGTTSTGSPIITGLSATADLTLNEPVTGAGIPANSFLQSIQSGSQVTLSANATASASVTLTFDDQFKESEMALWAAWFAQQYDGKVAAIEVVNEPNNIAVFNSFPTSAIALAKYRSLITAVTNAVRGTGANVDVIGCGYQGSTITTMLPLVTVDGVVYHPYGSNNFIPESVFEPPATVYTSWITTLNSATSLPKWETEWGISTQASPSFTQDNQAVHYSRRLLQAASVLSPGDHTFIYDFIDGPDTFGVMVNSTTPKTSYGAVQNIIGALAGTLPTPGSPVTISNIASGNTTDALAYAHQSPTTTVIAWWFGNHDPRTPPASSTLTLQFNCPHPFDTSTVLDPIAGTTQPLSNFTTTVNGSTVTVSGLPVSDRPQLIQLVNTTVTDSTPPVAPSPAGLSAVAISATQINLSWNAYTDPDDVAANISYPIEHQGGAFPSFIQFTVNPAGDTTASDTGLSPNTAYSYRLRGRDLATNTSAAYSATFGTTTLAAGDTTPPTIPVPSFGTVTSTSITLTWPTSTDVDNANNTLTYTIRRQINGGAFSTLVSNLAGVVSGNITYVDSGLTASTSYGYGVESFDPPPALNTNGFSATITTSTSPTSSIPVLIQATSASSSSSIATLSCSFPTSQSQGSANVVIIGWLSATGTISSVVDNDGNTYTPVTGTTQGTGVSQAIYIAQNINP